LVEYPALETSLLASSLRVGQPFTLARVYHYLNVDPITGLYTFENHKGNAVSSGLIDSARTSLINTSPQFYGGLENSIHYKGFELNFLFQFTKQVKVPYFFGDRPGQFGSNASGSLLTNNQPIWVMDRWQKPGDNATVQKFSTTYLAAISTPFDYVNSSDQNYVDASYIRLRNASLYWQIPSTWKQKIHLKNARVYIQGQNLLTITNYKGFDPELGVRGLPPLRVITMGVQINL
jgi:TonB-dependent starch-binding outer membrane protein SusC